MATNVDLSSVEGEIKIPINSNLNAKATFVVGDNIVFLWLVLILFWLQLAEQSQLQGDLEVSDESSVTQFQVVQGAESSLTMTYMQSVTPSLSLGGK